MTARLLSALRILAAALAAYVCAGLSIWWLGTAPWSVGLAVLGAGLTYSHAVGWLSAFPRMEVSRGRTAA